MAKSMLPISKSGPDKEERKLVAQLFKVDAGTYRKVRALAAARQGSGRASTGQDIYLEAVQQYLQGCAAELAGIANEG